MTRSPYFVFERIDLPSDSYWEVDAASEQEAMDRLPASVAERTTAVRDRATEIP